MPWLWDTWEEYVRSVNPNEIDRPNLFRRSHIESSFEIQSNLFKSLSRLENATESLISLGFTGKDHHRPPREEDIDRNIESLVRDAIRAGEELLLYHKPLATSEASYGFLHSNDLMEHWDRYLSGRRLAPEIHQLIKDIKDLLNGFDEITASQSRFILDQIHLPSSLEADFRLARNLFSVGFDEVGLLVAGRGLEGVLRKIAEVRKLEVEIKGKAMPASEADFYDLIELCYRVRWKSNRKRLITDPIRALLHYLRSVRNSEAHPASLGAKWLSARETAAIVAKTASNLWNEVCSNRKQFAEKLIQKNW